VRRSTGKEAFRGEAGETLIEGETGKIGSKSAIRAYAGLASSYFELVTENYQRLDDPTWAKRVTGQSPADVPWMVGLVAR